MYFSSFVLFKDLNLIWKDGSVHKGTHSVYKQEDLNANPPHTHVKKQKNGHSHRCLKLQHCRGENRQQPGALGHTAQWE